MLLDIVPETSAITSPVTVFIFEKSNGGSRRYLILPWREAYFYLFLGKKKLKNNE
jgi:hypothetical protein